MALHESLAAGEPEFTTSMTSAKQSFRSRKEVQTDRSFSHVPMGDERYRRLMSELGAAFAQADDGEEKRRQAREQERRQVEWLAQREAVILEILKTMRRHGLSTQDLA